MLQEQMTRLLANTYTRVTIIAAGPLGVRKLLGADVGRLYVEFSRGPTAAVLRQVIPGPVPDGYTGRTEPTEPLVYKFADCPSIVGGEWYGDQQAGIDWTILECIVKPG